MLRLIADVRERVGKVSVSVLKTRCRLERVKAMQRNALRRGTPMPIGAELIAEDERVTAPPEAR